MALSSHDCTRHGPRPADRGADPDGERILEGVAFLCGRIRQKLDDELPELTASMMSLLWPHYLRPVPSLTIMEFLPEIDAMQGAMTVPAGAEFASIPVDGTRCRYRSCWPTTLRPWVLRDVRLETAEARPVRLVMTLQPSAKAKFEKLDLSSVRFHLAGATGTAFALYLLLAGHVKEVNVSGGSSIRYGGFSPDAPHVVPAGLDGPKACAVYRPLLPGYRCCRIPLVRSASGLWPSRVWIVPPRPWADNRDGGGDPFDRRLETFPWCRARSAVALRAGHKRSSTRRSPFDCGRIGPSIC